MFIFKHGGRQAAQVFRPASLHLNKRFASKIAIPFQPPPFPVIESCPAPTCQCRESPQGLDIDREVNLNGSMATYAQQLLICTDKDDWTSKIEDEEDAVLVRELKKNLTRGGKFVDPYHNIMITNSSFPPSERSPPPQSTSPTPPSSASAYLLPSFKYIPIIPTDPKGVEDFIRAYLLPLKLHPSYEKLSLEQKVHLLRQSELQNSFLGVRPVDDILVLICGHGGRDQRCGKMAPILRAEFEEKLRSQNVSVLDGTPGPERSNAPEDPPAARIASISHIGGHKFAGNVIVYIPPSFTRNPLAGKGIWYGRVGPEHVEGIVSETILGGRVIKENFRGGVDQDGNVLRL
ncbi:uncharacterized protein MYCGRDRAFT_48604 [Zymoseptoria tritici IPO323]|uniref:Altered inheritance of mitochondria protein 32 n=1 Tax=Zymoseptoria tritici (strain CBS 115943 / IPO323) TaxID=336722 RepID=F9XLH5_ZYMTI|nr:uncharacterized protein MYCGRDRAFT_48604 [Zymoseptoria tritici IPO323]EGP84064.1 hypothetical protein MYCGRDRAFT_48604 [Zymoseptoria tritici IPO323]